MTPIEQLALEAAKALLSKFQVAKRAGEEAPFAIFVEDQELADLLAPFLRRAAEVSRLKSQEAP